MVGDVSVVVVNVPPDRVPVNVAALIVGAVSVLPDRVCVELVSTIVLRTDPVPTVSKSPSVSHTAEPSAVCAGVVAPGKTNVPPDNDTVPLVTVGVFTTGDVSVLFVNVWVASVSTIVLRPVPVPTVNRSLSLSHTAEASAVCAGETAEGSITVPLAAWILSTAGVTKDEPLWKYNLSLSSESIHNRPSLYPAKGVGAAAW
jgi:hypothetical protein